jgi:hypothetical protein
MGWLGSFAELRRFVEVRPWRTRFLDVHVDGIPEDLIILDPQGA